MSQNDSELEPIETFYIDNVETLKVLAHPQRLEILANLDQSRTVKEVAERMEAEDPTKLYYHVRMMEKVGLIRVTKTNVVSGIIEKQYRVVAHDYMLADGFVAGEHLSIGDIDEIANSIFVSTRRQLRKSVEAGIVNLKAEAPRRSAAMMSKSFTLTDAQLVQFNEQMQALMDNIDQWSVENRESEEDNADVQEYLFTIAFFPLISDK